MDRDEYYRSILEGLAVYFDSTMISDIARTVKYQQPPDLGNSLNRKQIRGKKWLVDQVAYQLGNDIDEVLILGGWYGILAMLMFNDSRLNLRKVTNLDVEPSCEAIAQQINHTAYKQGRFRSITMDMHEFEYSSSVHDRYLIVNTSCEHISDFHRWFDKLPDGCHLAIQSNNYYSIPEHINCVPNLQTLRNRAPLSKEIYAGELEFNNYTRFMLIGRK